VNIKDDILLLSGRKSDAGDQDMPSGTSWTDSFVRDGYTVFPSLVDRETVATACERIEEDLATRYDPSRKAEYDSRSFCPDLRGTSSILALLENDSVRDRVGELVNPRKLAFDTLGQIAIRRAHNAEKSGPPYAHVDGFPAPHNGVEEGTVLPFSILVGVFLSEVKTEFAGNFTVWPGSHFLVEKYFNERGHRALHESMPDLPKLGIGEPLQLMGSPGDVVLCHYALAHSAAVNTSDKDRVACFFRLGHTELNHREDPSYAKHAWKHLTQMWSGWKVKAPIS
jgi:Phytanoyl-CoA dioxygenase (PhyH)